MSAQEAPAAPTDDRLRSTAVARHAAVEQPARELRSSDAARSVDGELIRRIAEGDSRAFEDLYRRFSRPVLGLALRRLRDRSRAEDATQETFAAIWRGAATYRPERGPGAPWLYAVARNAIVNQARARLELVAAVPDTPSDEPSPVERVESDQVSARVHRALDSLPAQQRTLIELAYWSELSQSEIATRLKLPLGTVKTRTRAALARLAEVLERDELDVSPPERRVSRFPTRPAVLPGEFLRVASALTPPYLVAPARGGRSALRGRRELRSRRLHAAPAPDARSRSRRGRARARRP